MEIKFRERNKESINIHEDLLRKRIDEIVKELTKILNEIVDEVEKYRIRIFEGSWSKRIDDETKTHQNGLKDNISEEEKIEYTENKYHYGIKIDDKDILNEINDLFTKAFGYGGVEFIIVTDGCMRIQRCYSIRSDKYVKYKCECDCISNIFDELFRLKEKLNNENLENLIEKLKSILLEKVLMKAIEKISESKTDTTLLRRKLKLATLLASRLVRLSKYLEKEKVETINGDKGVCRYFGENEDLYPYIWDGVIIKNEEFLNALAKAVKHTLKLDEPPEVEYAVVVEYTVIVQTRRRAIKYAFGIFPCDVIDYTTVGIFSILEKLEQIIDEIPSLSKNSIKPIVEIIKSL